MRHTSIKEEHLYGLTILIVALVGLLASGYMLGETIAEIQLNGLHLGPFLMLFLIGLMFLSILVLVRSHRDVLDQAEREEAFRSAMTRHAEIQRNYAAEAQRIRNLLYSTTSAP